MNAKKLTMITLCLLLLAACGGKNNEPEPPPDETETPPAITATPTTRAVITPTPTPSSDLNELTGLPINPDYLTRRPIAVMLNYAIPKALPMHGVSQADVIYEVAVEGGTTRLLALFKDPSQIPEIGTVRSTRLAFLDIMQGHDAILVHCGGSPEAYDTIKSRGLKNIDGISGTYDKTFWRDAARKKNNGYEHSLFTSGERIEAALVAQKFTIGHAEGYSGPYVFIDDATPKKGEKADDIAVYFPGNKRRGFVYNQETGLYLYSYGSTPFMDGYYDKQLAVRNLIILRTDINIISGDSAGRLKIRTTGEGEGFYACGGKYIPITWSKEKASAPYVYTKDDGTPLELSRGNTFICVIGANGKVTWTAAD